MENPRRRWGWRVGTELGEQGRDLLRAQPGRGRGRQATIEALKMDGVPLDFLKLYGLLA